jgi:hypothetical protein
VILLVLALVVAGPGVCSAAPAQTRATSADLVGVVRDVSSAVLPDTHVTATNDATGISRATDSGPDGRFVLPALPVGTYTVVAVRQGFATLTVQGVLLTLGASAEVALDMSVAGVESRVTVAAERQVVAVPASAVASVVSQAQIDRLPTNDRAFIGFALTTPGVAPDQTPQQGASRTSGLTFAGQRARSNNITVDGLDNNDETVGSVRALFSQEAIREFQVIAGAFPAEFGKASGGIVNVVTRSGTNTFSGTAFGFVRDRALSAKAYFDRFDAAGNPLDSGKGPFSQHQFGGVFGGPVRKNRSFFFTSFERLSARISNFVTIDDVTQVRSPVVPDIVLGTPAQILRAAGFPVETGHVPYEVRASSFLGKVDLQLAEGHSMSLRVNTASELNENIEPFGGQVARSRAAALDSSDVMAALTDTRVFGQGRLNELRVQIAARNQLVRSLDPACDGLCDQENEGGPTLEVTGVASVGRQRFTPTPRDNTRYQVVDTVSEYLGHHQLKAGVDASFIQGRNQALPLHFGGRYIFAQQLTLPLIPGRPPIAVSSIQAVALGLPAAYVQGYGSSGRAYDTADLSLFAQDEWRVRPDLTLNAGLRYQRQFWSATSLTVSGYPSTYAFPSDNNNLAPRVGAVWMWHTARPTSVHGAYGVFYDNIISSVYGISKFVNGTDGVRTLVLPAPGAFGAWAAPGHRMDEASAVQLLGRSYASVAIPIDPGLRTPSAQQLAVGLSRDLADRWNMNLNFLHVKGQGQLGTIDYNPIVPSLGAGRRPADVNGVPGTSASVLQYTSFGETWYRGMTLTIDRRFDGGTQLRVSYTLSRAEDNSTDFQSAFIPQDNGRGRNPADLNGLPIGFDPDSERGPSTQDQRHRLSVSGTRVLGRGFTVSAIAAIGSGRPFNIVAGSDLNGDGDGGSPSPDRPRRVPGDASTSIGRNAGRLPSQATCDVRATKELRVYGGVKAELMVDVFNLFNRTNFIDVQRVFGTGSYPQSPIPTFGQFTQAAAPRQVQLGVKLLF